MTIVISNDSIRPVKWFIKVKNDSRIQAGPAHAAPAFLALRVFCEIAIITLQNVFLFLLFRSLYRRPDFVNIIQQTGMIEL